ncbi:hypothetical protein [Noviherbaspirillum autotrophicum]|uniref:Uncharacterized protein n=1 Tax=Noviherbaspirillum autotrophicum TaxID=709839 RepID=A0A0C2BIH9_9BURK|nr:hypothetical protein [Noviherbaspirillum autotrophicum]KIF79809.1 hypothetical protein TSA66_01525 [Noviherbaspirillum autotrophicum]
MNAGSGIDVAPWSFGRMDAAPAFLLAPQFLSLQFLSVWPSHPHWPLALGSRPYLVLAAAGYGLKAAVSAGTAYCFSDAMSITKRYFTSLFSMRS